MALESLNIREPDEDGVTVSKGIYITKKILILIICLIAIVIVALVLGLSLGLTNKYKNCDTSDNAAQGGGTTATTTTAAAVVTATTQTTQQVLTTTTALSSTTTAADPSSTTTTTTTTTRPVTGQMSTTTITTPPRPVKNYRLPKSLKPYYYDITTKTSFDSFTEPTGYDGEVVINFSALERTNNIVLHHADLVINTQSIRVGIIGSNGLQIAVSATTYDNDTALLNITLAVSLQANQNYSLSMTYQGKLLANNIGFYKSSYTDAQNKRRWLVGSHMEPLRARRAFPCFDEPGMKATFKMSVVHQKSLRAMSNMPEARKTTFQGDLLKTEFDTTVPMSTYLVALVISDFVCLNETVVGIGAQNKVDVNVCGRYNAIDQLTYALEMSTKIIKFFEQIYGVKYPLPKCDHIALPDFNAGAMENWGLVLYRESILFYDPKTSSDASKQYTVIVIAHELAHMWFGNLVTSQWWNDIWLNEGFATYVEYVGTDFAEPTFEMFEQFVERVFDVLQADSVANSRAISTAEENVSAPGEVSAMFDSISYGKGGSLIRMMNYAMGQTTFRTGIKNYLTKYQYSNAVQNDLWIELDKAAKADNKLQNLDVPDVMNTWTKQMGHPLITIEKIDNNNIRISQKHFLLDPTSTPAETSPFNYQWFVPFTYSVEKLGTVSVDAFDVTFDNLSGRIQWLRQNETSKTIRLNKALDSNDGFILANLDVSGFYRVNYDEANWNKIIKQLTSSKDAIPKRVRAQLINDAFVLAQNGAVATTRPFELIKYLPSETEYLPWTATISRLNSITNLLESTAAFGNYEVYLRRLIEPAYKRLGWEDQNKKKGKSDSWLDRRLRNNVLSFACARNLDDCVTKSKAWYAQWMQNENENPIPASARSFVYCTAIRNGGDKEWEFASKQYEREQSASQRENLQNGMACTKQPWLISRYLNDQVNASKVRLQDAASGISIIAAKSYANMMTWTFVKDNWSMLFDKISMGGIVTSLASKFNTKSQLDDFKRFFDAIPNQGNAARSIKAALDTIKANVRWMESSYKPVSDWLIANVDVVEPNVDYRLSTHLEPYHYDITIKPQFETRDGNSFPYEGEVTMHIICRNATSSLIFHINKIDVDNATLSIRSPTDQTWSEIKGFSWRNDYTRQFFIADLPTSFRANNEYLVYVKYTGYLRDDNAGFYRSSYKIGNETRWLLASQMEPTDARKSFPCFDEPALKTTYNISVVHREDYNAISNMPVARIIPVGNKMSRTEFQIAPRMSTYLVGLVVSDFQCINGTAPQAGVNGNLPIRVCARSNALDQLDYAMDVAIKSIQYFQKLYGVKYPLPKCDHIALPDFSAGAMENWGIITYREARLLYTAGVTSQSAETGIATVIVHEVAHMWFGDIVSPAWWNDLWLNEGFARYMQYVGTDPIKPEWEMYEQIVSSLLDIQQLDSVASSHAVSVEVNNPDEINELFDDITYGKGGSVIRMAEYFLGTDTFYRGINKYLNKYVFNNAVEDYLWDTLGEVAKNESKLSGLDMGDIMNTWTRQMGHPVITVKKVNDRAVSLTQNHFLLDPTSKPPSSNLAYKWYVPFTHSVERVGSLNNATFAVTQNNLWKNVIWVLPNETSTLVRLDSALAADDFILGNTRVSGFYRVNYDDENWDKIIKQLLTKKDAIPIRNRAQLINDAMSFSQSGLLDATRQFEIVKYLPEETEYLPWITAINRFRYLNDMLESTSAYGKLQTYLSGLIQPIYSKLGWTQKPSDSWLQRLLRTSVLSFACARGIPDCVNQAKSYYSTWMSQESNNPIPASYRAFVYCTAIREGGEKEWNFASEQYMKQTDSNQKSDLQSGMSCSRIPWLINRFLNDQLDTSKVRVQDTLSGLRAAATKAEANLLTWNFIKDNWKEIFSRYGAGLTFSRLITDLASKFNTQRQLNDYDQFFQQNPNQGTATREVKISRDKVKANINWVAASYDKIDKWLTANVNTTPQKLDYRLPTTLVPYHYDILLNIQFETINGNSFPYEGEIAMFFNCVKNTSTLTFHINNFVIDNSTIYVKGVSDGAYGEVKGFSWRNDYERQFFVADLPKMFRANYSYVVYLKFTGFMKDDNVGFYRSSYFDDNNQRRWLLASQMQPTEARKSFPCFDEPAMKASFRLSVIHRDDYNAISNMPVDKVGPVRNRNKLVKTEFLPTPKMSTYLVALLVSDFKCKTGNATNAGLQGNLPVRVCSRSNALDQLDYALEAGIRIIEFFEKLYNIKYPLPKCDHIALPDFRSGAMENWGMITYRESRIFYTKGLTSQSVEESIVAVIAHELAHMWFGDIVSPTWWNDLWLNEGFARYQQYVGTGFLRPEWDMPEKLTELVLNIEHQDSVASSHPISVDVNKPSEIGEIFDDISYGKGGSVLRMANYFVGNDTFYRGVTKYLNRYVYGNAVEDNLWDAIDQVAKNESKISTELSVTKIMNTWTRQMGHPVVKLTVNGTRVSLTQKHFLLDSSSKPIASPFDYKWYVPFTHTIEKIGSENSEVASLDSNNLWQKVIWFLPNETTKTIQLSKPLENDEFILGNIEVSGYYRINYDDENWNRIIRQLVTKKDAIPIRNRAQIINDAFSFAQAKLLDTIKPFEIIKYMSEEFEYLPWRILISRLSYFIEMLDTTSAYGNFNNYIVDLIKPLYDRLGWEEKSSDTWLQKQLRTTVLSYACARGIPDCLNKAKTYYATWMSQESNNQIPGNYRSFVYCTAIREGTEKEWNFAFSQYMKTNDANQKNELQSGMSCTRVGWLVSRFLNDQLDTSKVRVQDAISGLRAAAVKSEANARTWTFVKENWNELYNRYSTSNTLARLVTDIVSKFNTQQQLSDFEQFFDKTPNQGAATREVQISKEKIRANINWLNSNLNTITQWLEDNFGKPEKIDYRLPKLFEPYEYEILIRPQFDNEVSNSFPFEGEVTMHLVVLNTTSTLVFHIHDLLIDNTTLSIRSNTDQTFGELKGFSWRYDSTREFFVADLPRPLKANNNYLVYVKYTGYLRDDNAGFYRSSYKIGNETRWLLASQMEPTDARKSFPCFDEPAFKAVFKISVIHHEDYNAISNMPVDTIIPAGDKLVRTDFLPTPEMSTYLVGLVVSDFQCINGTAVEAGPEGNLPIRVCARSNALDQLDYAMNVAIKSIEFFEKLYAIKYPLPKCDHIALPDFSAGAMENWGIITYREARLLYTAGVTSQSAEQSIATVIVHEVAHMWFGDIVSPEWWNDLWLNEGFANFMEHVGTDHVKPDWEMYEQLTNSFLNVQQIDAVASSHEIAADVNNPGEINEVFDQITYNKGGAVIRMANYFTGNGTFYRGITKYLNKYVYGNAVQNNLWSVLDEVAKNESKLLDVNLINVMSTWTRQMGHPVVTLSVNGTRVSLTQKHFLLDPTSQPVASPYNYKWYIPFTHSIEKVGAVNNEIFSLSTNNLWNKVTWFRPNETTKTLTLAQPLGDDDFILANLEVSGFYRVNYDPENWDKIARQLQKKKDAIPTRSRAQLIHDAFSFSQANLIETTKPFEIIKYMSEETEYLPWSLAINRLGYITSMLESTSAFGSYQNYLIDLIKPIYNKLGWEEKPTDTWLQKQVRNNILSFACARGVPECVSKAKSYYATWILNENNNQIPASYRAIVYCTAIREGGEKEWNFASARYSKETDANQKNTLQAAMSCTRISWLISKFLSDQLDKEKVRPQDALAGLRTAASRSEAYTKTWTFIKDNWEELFSRYGNGLSFSTLIAEITTRFNTKSQLDDFTEFFETYPNQGSATREVKISKEKIRANINWIKNNLKAITQWLENNVDQDEEKPKDVRLPTDLAPILYDVTLTPYIGPSYADRAFTFDGSIDIHFNCSKATDQLIFHIKDLDIKNSSIKLTSTDDATLSLALPWTNDYAREFFKANFTRQCKQGAKYSLHVEYVGQISKNLAGFYRSSYTDKNNQTFYLATTHFQPTDARRAFPCFDEPAMKSKFSLTILRHKNFTTSFGNMPHEVFDAAVPGNTDLRRDKFKESVPMSTYLVAFVVANYKLINTTSPVNKIRVEVAARPEAINDGEGDFALDEAAEIIDFFASYFDTPYPLEKSTQIGVPDFNAGAMENWGLVTYRETALLYNPSRDSIANKRRVSLVVSHELAHQWFGNLVTPDWWNDLWLNEGFASWVEYLGYNKTHPEWRDLDSFFTQKLSVMVKDSLESSHPISVQVDNPDQINALFDSISYNKGASIIRMMNSFLTEKTFRGGVSKYLKKFEFSSANQDDLWQSLTDQAYLDNTLSRPLSVKTIMDTWTLQKGYPVVTLDRDYVNKKVKISQKWFLLNPEKQSIESTQEWFVPFTHTTQKNPVSSFIFEATPIWHKPKDGEVVVDLNADANEWLVGNLHHSGFYRVNYDKKNWDMLIAQLNSDHTRIHEINRATLIDDSFNLGRAEKLEQKVFLDIVKYLQNEQDPIPWTAAFSGMGYIGSMLSSTSTGTFTSYKKFYKNLLRQTYETYGWNSTIDDATLIDLQLQAIVILCSYEDDNCTTTAKEYFTNWRDNNAEIPPNFKQVVYQTAIKFGSEDDWYFLFNKAKETTSNAEQVRMFRALASTREYYLLKFLLSQTLVPSVIKPQDETSIISAVNGNIAGRDLAWEHFVANWNGLIDRYGSVSFTLGNLVINLLQNCNTQSELQQVLNFMQQNPDQGVATAAFKESVETISTNIRWMKTNFNTIAQFLNEQSTI